MVVWSDGCGSGNWFPWRGGAAWWMKGCVAFAREHYRFPWHSESSNRMHSDGAAGSVSVHSIFLASGIVVWFRSDRCHRFIPRSEDP